MDAANHRIGSVEVTTGVPPGHEICDPPPDSGITARCVADGVPRYELLVDGEGDVALDGGGIMEPWHAVPA